MKIICSRNKSATTVQTVQTKSVGAIWLADLAGWLFDCLVATVLQSKAGNNEKYRNAAQFNITENA